MKPLITESQFRGMYKLDKFADKAIDKFKLNFPIYPNENLVEIVSFLTFDGHLRQDRKGFFFTAGKKQYLKRIAKIVKAELKVHGKFRKVSSNNFGSSYVYCVNSQPLSRILEFIGTPKGNKSFVTFSVPKWIYKNLELSRIYLRTAFDCESSIWKENKNRIRIRFYIGKIDALLSDAIKFLKEMKNMLELFEIHSSETWVRNTNLRKDGKMTKQLCFNISDSDIYLFKEQIGFSLKNKEKLLNGVNIGHGT